MAESALRGIEESLRFGIVCRDMLRELQNEKIAMHTLSVHGHLYFLHSELTDRRLIIEDAGAGPSPRPLHDSVYFFVLLTAIFAAFILDLLTPFYINISLLYAVPLALAYRLRYRRLILFLAGLSALFTIAEGGIVGWTFRWVVCLNRGLSLIMIATLTLIALKNRRLEEALQVLQDRQKAETEDI